MQALMAIGWFVGLIISIGIIRIFSENAGMCRMFPEGFRWWTVPAELASYALFAAVVLFHPF